MTDHRENDKGEDGPRAAGWAGRPRPRPGSLVARVAFWSFLGVIPFSLLLFVLNHARHGGPLAKEPWTLIFIVIVLAAITWACAHIIVTHVSRDRWERRIGVACTRCGYELNGEPPLTCPECGSLDATRAPWRAPDLPIPAALLFVLFLVCALVSFVWPVITGQAGTFRTLLVLATGVCVLTEIVSRKRQKRERPRRP